MSLRQNLALSDLLRRLLMRLASRRERKRLIVEDAASWRVGWRAAEQAMVQRVLNEVSAACDRGEIVRVQCPEPSVVAKALGRKYPTALVSIDANGCSLGLYGRPARDFPAGRSRGTEQPEGDDDPAGVRRPASGEHRLTVVGCANQSTPSGGTIASRFGPQANGAAGQD